MPRSASPPTVNFLRTQRQQLKSASSRDHLILEISVGFLIVTLLVVVGLVVAWWWFGQQINTLSQQQTQQQNTIKNLASDEAQYVIYSHRLDLLASVFQKYTSQQGALAFLASITQPGVQFHQIALDAGKQAITFDVTADNLQVMTTFLDTLREPQIQSQIETLDISEVHRDQTGQYILNIQLKLKREL